MCNKSDSTFITINYFISLKWQAVHSNQLDCSNQVLHATFLINGLQYIYNHQDQPAIRFKSGIETSVNKQEFTRQQHFHTQSFWLISISHKR